MSSERNELHELVDQLQDDQLASVADDLRARMARMAHPRSTEPFTWVGAGVTNDGSTDVSADVHSHLVGFGSDSL